MVFRPSQIKTKSIMTKQELIQALSGFPEDAKIEIATVKKGICCTTYNYYDIENITEDEAGNPEITIKRRTI